MTRDEIIAQLLDDGAIRVDLATGLVYSNRRRRDKPMGSMDDKGYLRATVRFQGKGYNVFAHRIVAIAAYGVPGPGLCVAHLNHVRTDNRAANLAFVTVKENIRQSVEAGNQAKGESAGSSRLTTDSVRKIREAYASGSVSQRDLVAQYGVCVCTIHEAVTGETWKDAPGPLTRKGQPKGEEHHTAKLTADGVRKIRETYAHGGVTQQALADQYGVCLTTISNAITGETWKDAPGPLTKTR